MSTSEYVFTDTQHISELERLQRIEQVFDPGSCRRIGATGITRDWQCLEVGAGAGSMTRWLAGVVGECGQVVAIDLNTRFITNLDLPNVRVLQADIRHPPLEQNSFDLVHVRYVLIHIPDFQLALSRIIELLKPGGWMVIEEPDFSAARAIFGEAAACQSFHRVNRAIEQMFAHRGMDYALGVHLPRLLQTLGVCQLCVDNETPLSQGSSGLATVMKLSTRQLAQQYIATGEATEDDIEQYCRFADDPKTWAIYYATVGLIAQKPIA